MAHKKLRLCIVSIVAVLLVGPLFAHISMEKIFYNNSNDLLAAIRPISYGEESFRERILKRTQGERDPVGLVLSGGSARAFAHIGVLQYLEEIGIVPDFIISNSMGSIVGLLYAAGLSPNQILDVCSSLDFSNLFDLSWPLYGGFLDTSRFASLIAAYLGSTLTLEDLPIPIMVVSEDIVTKRQVHIMEGDLATVVEAAFALPIYFPPVKYQGHLLIDGGITNLVPLDVAYDFTNTVIVSTTFYEGKDLNLYNSLSILNTAIDIGKRRAGVLALFEYPQSLWIRCDVEAFSFMDFASMHQIAKRGYESARNEREALEKLTFGSLDEHLIDIRNAFITHQQKIAQRYAYYERFPQSRFSQKIFLGISSFRYPRDPWFLRDEVIGGLQYTLRWKHIWYSLIGGMSWESVSPMAFYPSISSSLSFQPWAPILLEADAILSFKDAFLTPSIYHRLSVQGKQSYLGERLSFTLRSAWEQQLNSDLSLHAMLIHSAIEVVIDSSYLVEGAVQVAGAYDRTFLHTAVQADIDLIKDFSLSLGYVGRYALDAKGAVPFFNGDGFRTTDATIRQQGSISSQLPLEVANHVVVAQTNIQWQPSSFKPTAGELLIFENSSIGLYGNFLWHRNAQWVPEISCGAQFSSTVSLLGLSSIPLSVFVGYDGPAESVVWGVLVGR